MHGVQKGCFGVKSRGESSHAPGIKQCLGWCKGACGEEDRLRNFEGDIDAVLLSPFCKVGALILDSRCGLHRQHWVMPKLTESPRVRIFLAVG